MRKRRREREKGGRERERGRERSGSLKFSALPAKSDKGETIVIESESLISLHSACHATFQRVWVKSKLNDNNNKKQKKIWEDRETEADTGTDTETETEGNKQTKKDLLMRQVNK